MTSVLTCRDYLGRPVILSVERWNDHILIEHPELRGNDRAIEATLISPHVVNSDKDFADAEVFYRRGILPPPDKHDYLKVVVRYRELPSGEVVGRVITAYAITAIPPEEPRRWMAP